MSMRISIFFIAILCLNTSIYPYQAEVENISNRNYPEASLNAINSAKESIVMGMYIISLPSGDGGGKVRYGEDLVLEAQGLAGIVYSAYDYDIVRDILEKIEIYGIVPVRQAFGYAKKMRVDNYKRTYNYIVNILKRA